MLYRPVRRYSIRSPWAEMERLHRDMNRLFYDSFSQAGGRSGPDSYPVMNVWTNEEGAVITAELPGVEAEDIDISVVVDTLTRSFQLPFRVGTDGIEATFEKGVLNISVPRSEADKPKKISVKSA